MANCCSKSTQPPTVISGQKDLVDLGKGSVKLKEKFKMKRGSLDSIYDKTGPVPIGNNTPIPMRKEFNIPIDHRRNSR